jgi:hypothetical protein
MGERQDSWVSDQVKAARARQDSESLVRHPTNTEATQKARRVCGRCFRIISRRTAWDGQDKG